MTRASCQRSIRALRIVPADMDQKSGLVIKGFFKLKCIWKNLQRRNGKRKDITYEECSFEVNDTVTLLSYHVLEMKSKTEQAQSLSSSVQVLITLSLFSRVT